MDDMAAAQALDPPKSDGLMVEEALEKAEEQSQELGVQPARRVGFLRRLLPGIAIAGGIGAVEVFRQRFQERQTFVPDRYPNGIWDPSPYGVEAEDVFFQSPDGTQLHGWWMPFKRARGTVLYCHGNSGNITHRIGVYRHMRRLKLNVLAFDYRGFGRSDGKPTEKGVYADARAAYDFLLSEIGETFDRVVLFGHSLGGAIAIDLALERPVVGLVAQSTFTSAKEMARIRFPSVPMHIIASNHFRSIEKVAQLEGVPKLFIHGTSDETIPYALGERLFEASAEPKEWYSVPYAGHNDVYRHGGVRYLWRVSRFMRRCLKEAAKTSTSTADPASK